MSRRLWLERKVKKIHFYISADDYAVHEIMNSFFVVVIVCYFGPGNLEIFFYF